MELKKIHIIFGLLFFIGLTFVAADTFFFTNVDYNQNSIVNVANITTAKILLENDPINHVIYDNSTCMILTGDTATINIC